jgi:uncharacterized membrane protein YkvA (DUF1232 family)
VANDATPIFSSEARPSHYYLLNKLAEKGTKIYSIIVICISMKDPFQKYKHFFSENLFWIKLKKFTRSAGVRVSYSALLLYYTYRRKETPKWAKKIIVGALGYFLSPIDAIPDLTPFLGYTDDLSIMAFALTTLAFFVNQEVKDNALLTLKRWFKEVRPEDLKAINDRI